MDEKRTEQSDPLIPASVLIVDDDPSMLRLLSKWLEKEGCHVEQAQDGEQALKMLDRDRPTILITDWEMPRMDGIELCREIRQAELLHHVYVLFLTHRTSAEYMLEALDAGADDFLSKAVSREQLLIRVRYAQLALQRLERYASLAHHDPLTDTLNRRSFDELGQREMGRQDHVARPLSCILLDIDLFKEINDTFGHAVGDAALQELADLLRTQSRELDHICRYGGDEFCVLLPNTDEKEAARWAERVRLTLAEQPIHVGDKTIQLRATFGVAEWNEQLETLEQLIDLADQAMLTAKHSGRDRVQRYGALYHLDDLDLLNSEQLREQLAGVQARQVMTTPIVTLSEDETLQQAADLFLRLRINSTPVVDRQNKLIGIISEKDLLNATHTYASWLTPIKEFMKGSVVCYDEDTPLVTIWEFLRRVTIRRVVIVKDGVPRGVISRGGLLRWVGNWGMVRSMIPMPKGQEEPIGNYRPFLDTFTALEEELQRFREEIEDAYDDPVPAMVNAATRLQQGIQDVLAYSQIHYSFEPEQKVADQ